MDVVTPEEARIAEEAGAVAVMALERVPADIRKEGGVARMSDPEVGVFSTTKIIRCSLVFSLLAMTVSFGCVNWFLHVKLLHDYIK